jgi:O-antigen/teichoic acid export membrane protein
MLMASIFPLMAARYPENPEGLQRIYQKTADYAAIIGGAISMGLFLGAPLMIQFVFGKDYLPAVTTLRLFGFIPLLIFLNNAFGNMVVAVELQGKPLLCMRGIGVLINVGLNLVCIPMFGYNGAAFATVITELALLAGVIVIIGRKIQFYPSLRNFFLMITLCTTLFIVTLSSINPIAVAIVSFFVFITMVAWICRYDRSELLATIFMKGTK